MDLLNATVIAVKSKKYIIVETIEHDNKTYVFTNEIVNEEDLTEDYYIFEAINEKFNLITDEELINILLPKFQEKLKKTIEKFL